VRIGDAIVRDAIKVTKAWSKHRESVIRSQGRARWRAPRFRRDTIKDVAWRILPEAYAKAAGQIGMAAPRQIFYAARPLILKELPDAELRSTYFTQTILPDYMAANRHLTDGWDIIWDDRGHLREPHTGIEIGLGTLAVREYLKRCQAPVHTSMEVDPIAIEYPTYGPTNRFKNALLIEKEGFQQLLEHAGIDTRYDLAIMSSKGMNTTSARTLVERLPGVRFLVLHDFDKSGFSILGTLTRSTRRYHFHRLADVVDLGIRLDDVEAEDLDSEPVDYRGDDPGQNLRDNGATEEEIEYLVGGNQRVEINAFDSDHLIEWLEQKLDEHGVEKLIPDEATLASAYRRALVVQAINQRIAEARDDAEKQAAEATIPESLADDVRQALDEHPEMSWDAAVAWLLAERTVG